MAFNSNHKIKPPKAWKIHPNSLANLKPQPGPLWTKEQAQAMREKGLATRLANKENYENLLKTMQTWDRVKKAMPDITPLDVMEMAMMTSLSEGNFEDATRFANMLAPYKAAKLASIEQTIKTDIRNISDDELRHLIAAEGLKIPTAAVQQLAAPETPVDGSTKSE